MEKLKATRRMRMQEIVDEEFEGRQVDFAEKIERQPDYVSRCLTGKKGIGERLARDIERRLELEEGWMDKPGSLSDQERLSQEDMEFIREIRRRVALHEVPSQVRDAICIILDATPRRAEART